MLNLYKYLPNSIFYNKRCPRELFKIILSEYKNFKFKHYDKLETFRKLNYVPMVCFPLNDKIDIFITKLKYNFLISVSFEGQSANHSSVFILDYRYWVIKYVILKFIEKQGDTKYIDFFDKPQIRKLKIQQIKNKKNERN